MFFGYKGTKKKLYMQIFGKHSWQNTKFCPFEHFLFAYLTK